MWSPLLSVCVASAVDNASFTSSLLVLLVMIGALAALPWLLKRWQQRRQVASGTVHVSAQVLSAVNIGPGQRVVTVEVGQGTEKTCLVLGVTAHNIHCLHVLGSAAAVPPTPASFAGAMAQAQEAVLPAQS